MTRLRTLPLALIALALLAGCGGPAPPPSLTSADRNERLEAVRNAHGKYGAKPPAPAVAPAKDREAIVGRWDHPWGWRAYLQFNADGTFKAVGLLVSPEGRYRVLPGGMIELDYPGTFYGRNVVKLEYRLTGETLELMSVDGWVKYTKAS
jgi:hypothetical protein